MREDIKRCFDQGRAGRVNPPQMEICSGWWASDGLHARGVMAGRLFASALSLPVGHLVVEEARERLFCFRA